MKILKNALPYMAATLLCSCAAKKADTRYAISYDAPDTSNAELMALNHPFVPEKEAIRNQEIATASIVSQLDSPPKFLHSEFPPYPEEAMKSFVQGVVVVSLVADKHGKVVAADVLSSPDSRLSEVCLSAVRTWRFAPMTIKGKPTEVRLIQKFPFVLHQ